MMKEYEQHNQTELPTAYSFKYFGTMIDQEDGCSKELDKRIVNAWNRWREIIGVLCDKRIPTHLKVLMYNTAIKLTLMYGSEI